MTAVRDDLASWPAPFELKHAAVEYFGGPSLKAEAWADGLEERDDGWRPRWEVELMEQSLREAFVGREYWEQWEAIRCPNVAVRPSWARRSTWRWRSACRTPSSWHSTTQTTTSIWYHPEEWCWTLTGFLDSVDAG